MRRPTRVFISAGFTFIELVIAIALLGIISVTVSSRWFSTDAFGADTLRSELIAQARLAQRTALSNSGSAVALVVSASGDQWRLQIFVDDGGGRVSVRDVTTEARGVPISVTAGSAQSLGAGVSLDITYDALGNITLVLVGGSAQTHTSGVALDLMNTHQFCISPLGFAHVGSCV